MKQKILMLLAAMLLSCASALAQGTPIKGDVNEDGKVDVADINAVIEIMKNGGGTGGNSAYYFYVGLEKPTSATNPAANTVGSGQQGWHLIGDTFEGYSLSNPIYNGGNPADCINLNPEFDDVDYYIALPVEIHLRDGSGTVHDAQYLIESDVEIKGHKYNIFKDHFSDAMFIFY